MLTKAFVVLVSVLSVVLVALVTAYVAAQDDLRAELNQQRQQLEARDATIAQQQARLNNLEQQHSEQLNNLRNERNALVNEVDRLEGQVSEAESALSEEKARIAELEASVARLSAAGTQNAGLLEQLNDELQRRREEAVVRQRQIIESTDRIAELESEVSAYTREVRRQREQMAAMQEDRRELEERWDRVPESIRVQITDDPTGETVAQAPHPIMGQITAVRESGDELLVQVNVGDRDGVLENLPFMVYRGDEFIGMLMIEQVDTNASVGRMTLIQGQVEAGDRIYVGPELAARDLVP